MSWADYNLGTGIKPNAPIKKSHLNALIAATRERMYVAGDWDLLEDNIWAEDFLPHDNSKKYLTKDILYFIDEYLWGRALTEYCYINGSGSPTYYDSTYLQTLVGSRVTLKQYPSASWFNQIIDILNLYINKGNYLTSFGNTLRTFSTRQQTFYKGFPDHVKIYKNEPPLDGLLSYVTFSPDLPTFWWSTLDSGFLYWGGKHSGESTYYVFCESCGDKINYYFPLYNYDALTNLNANFKYYFYTIKSVGDVFQPLNGMSENSTNLWKNAGSKSLLTNQAVAYVDVTADIINGNTWLEPPAAIPPATGYQDSVAACFFDESRIVEVFSDISFKYRA